MIGIAYPNWVTRGISVLIGLLSLLSCSDDAPEPVAPEDPTCPPGQWAPDTSNQRSYRHDCEPYAGTHFTVYSDASSLEAKQTLAGLAEEVFEELSEEVLIHSDAELGFTPGYTYYIYAQRYISPARAEGYRNGFLIWSVDYGAAPGVYYRDPEPYLYTLKHELMHVFQFTLTDCPSNLACPTWLDVWFREGQAVVMGGGYSRPALQELIDWRADPDHINPIRISRWSHFPNPDRGGDYYWVFALTYAWLTDSVENGGHGATMADIRNMFRYMAEGDSFTDAFDRALGISLADLEAGYFDTMYAYLGG